MSATKTKKDKNKTKKKELKVSQKIPIKTRDQIYRNDVKRHSRTQDVSLDDNKKIISMQEWSIDHEIQEIVEKKYGVKKTFLQFYKYIEKMLEDKVILSECMFKLSEVEREIRSHLFFIEEKLSISNCDVKNNSDCSIINENSILNPVQLDSLVDWKNMKNPTKKRRVK